MATIDETVIGSTFGSKRFVQLQVNPEKAYVREGILDDIVDKIPKFNSICGYEDPVNKSVYDALWGRVFRALTGERVTDCMEIWLVPEDKFEHAVLRHFKYYEKNFPALLKAVKVAAAINIENRLAICKDYRTSSVLGHVFHEMGHRVFQNSSDDYKDEVSAYYFMCLALKKIETELAPHGLSERFCGFRRPRDDFYFMAFQEARRLVDMRTPYVRQLE